ncbi:MAG: hypothetical protein V3R90_05110, partial [Limibaculum sp.]
GDIVLLIEPDTGTEGSRVQSVGHIVLRSFPMAVAIFGTRRLEKQRRDWSAPIECSRLKVSA